MWTWEAKCWFWCCMPTTSLSRLARTCCTLRRTGCCRRALATTSSSSTDTTRCQGRQCYFEATKYAAARGALRLCTQRQTFRRFAPLFTQDNSRRKHIALQSRGSPPLSSSNVAVVERENTCFDFGAWGVGLRTAKRAFGQAERANAAADAEAWALERYTHFVLMNASVRGPRRTPRRRKSRERARA